VNTNINGPFKYHVVGPDEKPKPVSTQQQKITLFRLIKVTCVNGVREYENNLFRLIKAKEIRFEDEGFNPMIQLISRSMTLLLAVYKSLNRPCHLLMFEVSDDESHRRHGSVRTRTSSTWVTSVRSMTTTSTMRKNTGLVNSNKLAKVATCNHPLQQEIKNEYEECDSAKISSKRRARGVVT